MTGCSLNTVGFAWNHRHSVAGAPLAGGEAVGIPTPQLSIALVWVLCDLLLDQVDESSEGFALLDLDFRNGPVGRVVMAKPAHDTVPFRDLDPAAQLDALHEFVRNEPIRGKILCDSAGVIYG